MELQAELVFEISCDIGKPLAVGETKHGFLRVIPITGGTFRGKINGQIVPGGADWNTTLKDGSAHVFAKYTLRTDDGAYISVQNEGYLENGQSFVRTTPRFLTDETGQYAWLSHGVYAGTLSVRGDGSGVNIQIFKLS